MRSVFAGFVLLFGSAAFAQQSLALPQVDVTAERVQHVPPLALTLKTETFGCDIAIPPGVADASDALRFASGPYAEVGDGYSLLPLTPLASISWSEGIHFNVVGAEVQAWRRIQLQPGGWHTLSC